MSPRKNKKSGNKSRDSHSRNKAKVGCARSPAVSESRAREQLDGVARIKRIEASEQGLDLPTDTVAPDPNLKHQTQQRGRKGKQGKGRPQKRSGKSDLAAVSRTPKPARPSLLNAAAIILAESAAPMRVKDILARIEERGLWASPKGKTPGATLNASIIREIASKGEKSRFRKADRGLFTAITQAEAGAEVEPGNAMDVRS